MIVKNNWRLFLGGLLLIIGVAALLDSLKIIPFSGLLWGVLFTLGGVAFIMYLFQNRKAWWAVIPGFVLIGLGMIILLSTLFPNFEGAIGGSILFVGISAAFITVYLMNRKFWWAIIPAGVMASLAGTVLVDEFTRIDGGGVLFLGLALTFLLLTLLPGLEGNRQWPLIPAGILFVLSLFIFFENFELSNILWAVILIAVGVFLVLRSFLQRK